MKLIFKDLIKIENAEPFIKDIFEMINKGVERVNSIILDKFIKEKIKEIIDTLYSIKENRKNMNKDIKTIMDISKENEEEMKKFIEKRNKEQYEIDNIKICCDLLVDYYFECKKKLLFELLKKNKKFKLSSNKNAKNVIDELFNNLNKNI